MHNFIINFHGIGLTSRRLDKGEENVWISENQFVSIIETVCRLPNVLITFDDGNLSDYTIAFPHLKRLGLTAEFFVLGERIGIPEFLTADQIKEMHGSGMRFGSHGMSHVSWKKMTIEKAKYEINKSINKLEDILGLKIDSVACPFGTYDKNTLRLLKEYGIKRVYTSDGGYSKENDWLIARNSIHAYDVNETIIELMRNTNQLHRQWIINLKKLIKRSF